MSHSDFSSLPTTQKTPTVKISVSIIMAVYNAENTISEAVSCLLKQDFSNFEFIIIDDGSNDKTNEILQTFCKKDSRIRLITQSNVGLTISLNRGIALAKGDYIARQDADDYSRIDRLTKQVAFMEAHPEIDLLGSNSSDSYEDGSQAEWGFHEEDSLQNIVYTQTPFPHSTIMMRRKVAQNLGGYDETYQTSQDMELWMRIAKQGRIGMLPDKLIERNVLKNSISSRKKGRQLRDASRARWVHAPNKFLALYQIFRQFSVFLLPEKFARLLKRLK